MKDWLLNIGLFYFTGIVLKKQAFKTLSHCTYNLQYHLVIVTKYRRKCLDGVMLDALKAICEKQITMKSGSMLEFNGEDDHVHLLIELPPKVAISVVVNSLKTVSSRLLRGDFGEKLKRFYWKPILWSRSYFVASCGGAPLSVIKQYIQQQEAPD
jgi:putative transposase